MDMSTKKNDWLKRLGRKASERILDLTGNKGQDAITKKDQIAKKMDYGHVIQGIDFLESAQEVLAHGRTLMTTQRLYVLWQSASNTLQVTGDVAEVGVFRGGSSYFLSMAYSKLGVDNFVMHAIDTFEGHAAGTISTADNYHQVGMFADTSYEAVSQYLSRFDFLQVHKGEFSTVTAELTSEKYRLVHIDTDLYQPTWDCFEYFMPKLSRGGIFIIDDYLSRKCSGVTTAVHEFLEKYPVFDVWFFNTEQIVLVHRPIATGKAISTFSRQTFQ